MQTLSARTESVVKIKFMKESIPLQPVPRCFEFGYKIFSKRNYESMQIYLTFWRNIWRFSKILCIKA